MKTIKTLIAGATLMGFSTMACAEPVPQETDTLINSLMKEHEVPGLAFVLIENGEVRQSKTYGYAKVEEGQRLNEDTVMYAASLTKLIFSVYVLQLVGEGKLDLDRPIGQYLRKPLPAYAGESILEDYSDLEGDPRWQKLTLRMLLSHTTGLPNYRFFTPEGVFKRDAKLKFFFDPNERYGYSGEGYYIAQLVVEEATGLKTGAALQTRFFDPLGMSRTSLVWRDDFQPNFAHGYNAQGENLRHNMQSNVRAAGSMDTTLHDLSRWVAALMSGKLLGEDEFNELVGAGFPIESRHQFPTLDPVPYAANRVINLAAGVGTVNWDGPQGRGFVKGGHNEKTDNLLVCLPGKKRCVLLMSNTAKGDLIFPQIFEAVLGNTGLPWTWEYATLADK
ncbi:serine hydrolase domain-containing protein [Kordiimonas aestuarii]|uniref:serine hydrolase domain-containing protein n=1 Tax=Kordiimonas aestuarii TaxID=1005925 RepID=UPI0021D37187|nr:serine hydrolase domain-containing protein [Kordiimonas aestuarii]